MATTENEHYLRSILMLTEGGSYISKMVLYRELSGELDTLLKSFKGKLKHELHEKQYEKVFPSHGKTVVDTWDLQMLIIVVLRLFHTSLKKEDKNNLRVIKMLRHEVQAHNPGPTLDDVQYDNIKGQLTDALTSLASGFDGDVQKECRSYITKYASGPLDVTSARECLKQLQENDVMFKQVLEKVEKSNNDICAVSQQITDLEKTLMERLEKLDIGPCRKKIKVGMHVELALGGPTEEWIMLMERTLNDIFNEAYKTSGGKFEDMKKKVEELLDDIKQNTTIKFKGSKTKCIILMFECSTFAGLLDFLQYITSQKYQDRLDALTTALSAHFRVDFSVTVTSKIKDECLQNAIDILDTTVEHDEIKQRVEARQSHPSDEYKKSLRLTMECSSAEDLVYLWKMFQQGDAKHYLDRIADVFSEHSGQRITLTSSIDLEEFTKAIEETEDSMKDFHKNVKEKYDADRFRLSTAFPLAFEKPVAVVRGAGKTTGKQITEDQTEEIPKDAEVFYSVDDFPVEIAPSGISEDTDFSSHSSDSVELADAGEFQLDRPIYQYQEWICGRFEDTDFSSRSSAWTSEDTDFSGHSSGRRSEDTDFSSRSSAGRSEDSAYYSHSTGGTSEDTDFSSRSSAVKTHVVRATGKTPRKPKTAGRSEDSADYSHSTAGRSEDSSYYISSTVWRSEDTDFSSRSSAGRSEDSAHYRHSTDGTSEDTDFSSRSSAVKTHFLHATSNTPRKPKTVRDDSEDVKGHTQLRSESVVTSTETNSPHVWSVESEQSYTIKIEGDGTDCDITGNCMLPTGEILLADWRNNRLKKLNDRYQVISVCDLPDKPYDVCYCGNNEAVLAMGNSLQFVDVRGGMSLTRKVETDHRCSGLTCHGNQLYVADYNSVYIYSTDGIKQRVLYTIRSGFSFFCYIAVSDDSNYIYITEPYIGLHTIDIVGNHLYTLSDAPLYGTTGVCVDGEGHVLLSMMTGNVMQLSSDGKQKLGIIVDTISKKLAIRTICFIRSNTTLIVAGLSNKIHVFKLK